MRRNACPKYTKTLAYHYSCTDLWKELIVLRRTMLRSSISIERVILVCLHEPSARGKTIISPGSIIPNKPIQPCITIRRCERVSRLQIGLFISLNHQLVHDHDIVIGYRLSRLQAQVRLVPPLLDHLHLPLPSRYAVNASWITWALDIEIAFPLQLIVLFTVQH